MSYQFAEINGLQLHYDVQGQGEALVLIHAGIANMGMWADQVPAFSQDFQVIRYDVRGFGETPDPPGNYTDYADLKSLLDFLSVDRAHVLGISNGGRIALDFVLSYPQMVDKLVLVAPGLPGFRPPADPGMEEKQALYSVAEESGDVEGRVQLDVEVWVDGPRRTPQEVDPEFRRRATELIRHTIELGIGEGVGDIARPPAAERLHAIQAPTLLVLGQEDLPSMHAIVDQLEASLPNVRRADMAGTAHLPPMEKADEFNRIVLDFLLE